MLKYVKKKKNCDVTQTFMKINTTSALSTALYRVIPLISETIWR